MKYNSNTNRNENNAAKVAAIVENEGRIIAAIKKGNHDTREIIEAADMFTEYAEFCEAIAALQIAGLVESLEDGYHLTEKGEYLTAYDEIEEAAAEIATESETADRMEADRAARVEVTADYLSKGAAVEPWTLPGRFVVALDDLHRVNVSAAELGEAKSKATAPAESVETVNEVTTAYHHTTAARVAQVCKAIAEAVGVFSGSQYPAADMVQDLNRFAKWEIAAEANEEVNPAAPFFFAVRKQGSESGTREHCKSRCAVLGAPLYVIKVEREDWAGLYTLKVRVPSPATAEKVTEAATATKSHKADELDNETDPARVPDWTRHAYEVAEMKRTGCTFGEARAKVAETRARILARREDNNDKGTQSEPSKPAQFAAVVADYTVGTWDSVKTRTRRAAAKVGRIAATIAKAAALLVVRVLVMAVGLVSGLSLIFAFGSTAHSLAPHTPAGCLLVIVPAMFAAVGLWAVCWCWSVNHLPARVSDYIMHGQC